MSITYIHGDARDALVVPGSVNCVITSPPYFANANYGDDKREIGKGTLAEFVFDITTVGKRMYDALDDRGVWWLNIGDTAAGSGGAGGDYNRGGSKDGKAKYRQGDTGLARMQWCNAPERVLLALQDTGWLVRHKITWVKTTSKGNNDVRPESMAHVRRPMVSTEWIFMLAKGPTHRFNVRPKDDIEFGSAWHMQTERDKKHALCPFPAELPRRCLKLTFSDEEMAAGATVLDPFSGSGTTLEVADGLGCDAYGIELYPSRVRGVHS